MLFLTHRYKFYGAHCNTHAVWTEKRRHSRGARALSEVQNREVQFRMVKQPRWGVENPKDICLKKIASYGRFGQHIEGTEIRRVGETFLPTIFYNGFSGMRRKRQ